MTAEYVTFYLQGEVFALPLERVREIIRMPDVARVPLAPASLEGLANLRGVLLPVVCLHHLLFQSRHPPTDATRVVVAEGSPGHLVGFVVDRMDRVLMADPGKLETADNFQDLVHSEYLVGVMKNTAGHPMILIFDLEKLMTSEYATMTRGHTSHAGLDTAVAEHRQAAVEAETQLVTFLLNHQEYAFPIQKVREIIRIPPVIGHVPKSADYLLGMINLRDELLPLVSLRRIFGMTEDAMDETSRVGVIDLNDGASEGRDHLVGVVMDRVREVLRVPARALEPTPALLHDGETHPAMASVCRLAHGRRLVAILATEHLLDRHALKQHLTHHLEGAAMTLANSQTTADRLIQVVVFHLNGEEYGVSIDAVQEIIRAPETMTHVPRAPAYIEGMVNLRGTLLPVVDLRVRLGMPHLAFNDRQRILVIHIDGKRTGFTVDAVSEVRKIPQSMLEEAPHFSEEQTRFVRQVANLGQQKRMIMLIELASMMEHHPAGG